MLLIKNGYMIDPKSGWDGNYDILVDGEFIQELKDISLQFRGSSNQRILHLKDGKLVKEGL